MRAMLPPPELTLSERVALEADGLLQPEAQHDVPLDPRLPRGIAAPLLGESKPHYQEGE